MKKKLLRFLCIMLLTCSLTLSGCIGTGGSGSDTGNVSPPGDDLTGTAGNAENIMNTKDNVTYYYKTKAELAMDAGKDANDRNNLKHTFGDAYVFVDPGSDYQMVDHYSTSVYGETSYPFYKLVGRQVELMADILTNSISRVYLDGSIYLASTDTRKTIYDDADRNQADYSFGLGEEDSPYNTKEAGKTESREFLIFDESPADESAYIDLSNIYSYIAFTDLTSPSAYWAMPVQIDAEETIVNQYILNLNYAVLGGVKIHKGEFGEDENKQYYAKYYGQSEIETGVAAGDPISTYINSDSNETSWAVIGEGISDFTQLGAVRDKIKNGLMSCIAAALSGMESVTTDAGELADNYEDMLRAIDHLGFTATDKLNVINQIFENVIGDVTMSQDKSFLKTLQDEEFVDGNLRIRTSDLQDVFYNSTTNFSIGGEVYEGINYKGYEIVIPAMVEQASTAIIDVGFGEETAFPGLPRVQIIKMDSWNLMDPVEEEAEEEEPEEGEEVEEVNPDDIITDVESIEFKEKFGNFQKIVAILFEPMQVYGERTMAIKENGEWVKDEDGNVKLKTFTVEGFILTGSDLVMLSEEDKMANYKIDYQIHTVAKDIRVTSDIAEVGYVKPDPSEEATYNSTTTLDVDKQEIIEKEEEEISDYRIQGYDGFSIIPIDIGGLAPNQKVDAGLINQEEEIQPMTGLKITLQEDGTSLIDISTEMYKYIGIYDVNGDAGTTFAGYLIDASGLAGNNYLITNFSILEVNEDPEDRECNLNILYYYMDCT